MGLLDAAPRTPPCPGVILGCGRAPQSKLLQAPNEPVLSLEWGSPDPATSGQTLPKAKQRGKVTTQDLQWAVVIANLAWYPASA